MRGHGQCAPGKTTKASNSQNATSMPDAPTSKAKARGASGVSPGTAPSHQKTCPNPPPHCLAPPRAKRRREAPRAFAGSIDPPDRLQGAREPRDQRRAKSSPERDPCEARQGRYGIKQEVRYYRAGLSEKVVPTFSRQRQVRGYRARGG